MQNQRSFLIPILLLVAAPATAQTTYTWTGTTGSWNDPVRWEPNGVPGADDIVNISSGTATLSGNTTVASLHLSNQGTISGDGDLTITESMVWVAAGAGIESLGGTGTVTVASGATLSMTGTNSYFRTGPNRNFVNAGTAVWNSRGEWGGQGQFINEGELELSYDAETPTRFCFSSTTDAFVNGATGIIRRTGSGELIVYCPFSNHGQFEVLAGTLRLRDFNGNGGTDSGAYAVSEGAVLIFDGARTLTETASVTSDGIVRTGGNSTRAIAINGTFSVPIIEASGAVRLEFNTDTTVETLLMGATGSLSSGQIGGSGTLTVTDELRWLNGHMHGSGTTVVAEGATFELDVRSNYVGTSGPRTFINEGAGIWTGTHSFSNGSNESTFINRGTLELATEWTGSYGTVFFAGTFINEGTFIAASDTTMRVSSGFDNHGLVDVRSGRLELSGFNATGGTDSGRYVVADGARLAFTGGQRTLTETASIEGHGEVYVLPWSQYHHVNNGATWRPGASPGTLTVTSDYPAEEGVLEIELAGYTPGTEHDQLIVTGKARLSGTLRVDVIDDFVPSPGDFFTVLTAEEVIGTVDVVEGTAGFTFGVGYTDTTVVVTVAGSACADGLQADEHTIALYKFDEPEAGVSFDASGNGNDGIDHGTTVVDGRFCNARSFDGEDDRIDMDAAREALQGSTGWSIEYVARSEDGNEIPALINHSCGNGWVLAAEPGGIRNTIKTTGVGGNCPWTVDWSQGLAEIPLDTLWHYYALTWDGDSLRAYRDGEHLSSFHAPGTFEVNQQRSPAAWLGYSDHNPRHYSGLADDLRISDISRSSSEIRMTAGDLGFIQPSVSVDSGPVPASFTLHPPFPNPFSGHASVNFDLPEAASVQLTVYDILGRRVAVLVDEVLPPGRHAAEIDADGLSAGIYLVHLQAGQHTSSRRVVLVR